jgi:hypothetical protein
MILADLQHTTAQHNTTMGLSFAPACHRLRAAGWSDCVLLTSAELESKYAVPRGAQPILLGSVA